MALPDDYLPEVTFRPQCSQCEMRSGCTRKSLWLYRRNYIECKMRVSAAEPYEPNTGAMGRIMAEFDENASLYTEEELAEARKTLERLKKSK